MFAPEYSYFVPYCLQCDTTFLFLEESFPGGRSSEAVYCPECGQKLGNIEEDSKLLAQTKGDFSLASIDEFAKSLSAKDRQELEATIRTPAENEAELKVFIKALQAEAGGETSEWPHFSRPDVEFNEEAPLVYSGPKPSETTNVPWISALRLQGEYSEPTDSSGKWLVFTHEKKMDALWAKIKKATESGNLGYGSKVSTQMPSPFASNPNEEVICVYTYDGEDKEDVVRVREELRSLGVTWECSYKLNKTTRQGKYSVTGHRVGKYRM